MQLFILHFVPNIFIFLLHTAAYYYIVLYLNGVILFLKLCMQLQSHDFSNYFNVNT